MSGFRWQLYDPVTNETATLILNPNQGGSLPLQKNVSVYTSTADNAVPVFYEGADPPQQIQAQGTLLTQAHYNQLVYWYSKRRQIQLTDDLGRVMWVYFVAFNPQRKWSVSHPFRHDYSLSMFVVGQQAETVP